MSDPSDLVSFLAASRNRVDILEAVSAKPLTRADIQRTTDSTRATLGRSLADLNDRDLVRQDGTYYEATPQGAFLVRDFQSLVESVHTVEHLGPLLEWFPVDDVSFELGRLRDAKITRPSKQDALQPVTRSLNLLHEAAHISMVAGQYAPPALEATWDATVVQEHQALELVLTDAVIQTIVATGDPDRSWFRELVSSERSDVYTTSWTLGYNVGVIDDVVFFALSDDHGAPQALIETEDPAVQEWFATFFRNYVQDATEITVDDLSE